MIASLDKPAKERAIVDPVAPDEILTMNFRRVDATMPLSGLSYSAMSGEGGNGS